MVILRERNDMLAAVYEIIGALGKAAFSANIFWETEQKLEITGTQLCLLLDLLVADGYCWVEPRKFHRASSWPVDMPWYAPTDKLFPYRDKTATLN